MRSNRRKVRRSARTAVMAAALCLGAFAATTSAADEGDSWVGAGVLKGGKGYAPTPMGQVHYRDLGPRDSKVPPLLLLHMTPLWMMQFADAQPELAALGLRSIAVDTPGYGLSDPPSKQPSLPDFANNLIAVLDHLKIARVVVVGSHTGSGIGATLAANHPDRVAAVILYGVPMFNAAEIKLRLDRGPTDRTPRADGSHLSRSFRPAAPGDPPRDPDALKQQTWSTIATFLVGPDFAHHALFHHDLVPDVKRIKAPGMIVSDVEDSIHAADVRAAKLRPDFAYKEFSNGRSLVTDRKAWAKTVADFVRRVAK